MQYGYLGAENQAIRVEIGSGGNKLLWGYDNASPLYRVQVTNDAAGAQVVHFLQPPKDEAHWPLAQQVIELLPWSAVLPNGQKIAETSGGFLAKVTAAYDPNTQTIKLAPRCQRPSALPGRAAPTRRVSARQRKATSTCACGTGPRTSRRLLRSHSPPGSRWNWREPA